MMWTVTNIWLSHLFTCLTQNWSTWDIFHWISFKWCRLQIWHLLPFQQIFQKRLNLLKNCLFEKCSDGQSVFKSLLTHELINYTSFLNNKSYLIWQNLTLHFCQLSKKSLIYFWKRDFHLESHFDFFCSVSTVFSRSVTERRQFDDRGLVSTSPHPRQLARKLIWLTGALGGMPSVHSTLTPVSLAVWLEMALFQTFWHFYPIFGCFEIFLELIS